MTAKIKFQCLKKDLPNLNRSKRFILLLFFQFTIFQLFSQVSWEKTYGGDGDDSGLSVLQTSDDGYIICGRTNSFPYGYGTNAYIIKTDGDGDTLWTKSYGGYGNDAANSLIQFNNQYIACGQKYSYETEDYDMYLLKLNSDGDTIWTKTFGGNSSEIAFKIISTYDSNYVMVGYTESYGYPGRNVYLVKTDTSGTMLWSKVYGLLGEEIGYDVAQTNDSGFIICARVLTETPAIDYYDFYLIRTNSAGDTIWTRKYGGIYNEEPRALAITLDGGYIICGYTSSFGAGLKDIYVVKTNSIGDTIWTRTYGGSDEDIGWDIEITDEGGYITCCQTRSSPDEDYDINLIRLNADGDTIWSQIYGSEYWESGRCVQITNDNAFIACGYTELPEGHEDVYLIKTPIDTVGSTPYYTPIWSGNPYQPMNIIITAAVVDGQALQPGDEIGVFDTDENNELICVGAGILINTITSSNPLIIVTSADDPTTPEIDGFTSGHEIVYRIWQSSEQEEITIIEANYDLNFNDNYTPLGTALVEINGFAYINQSINLVNGWNIMSSYVTPEQPDMLNVLQPLIDANQLIKAIDESGGFIQYIPGIGWMNTIGDMENTEGYYIKVNASTQLNVSGQPTILPMNIPLLAGWNIMGYPITQSQNALNVVQPLITSNELIKVVNESGGFIQYIPGLGWMNTIGNFNPGEGYYIKVSNTTTLEVNEIVLSQRSDENRMKSRLPLLITDQHSSNPYSPMNILISDIAIEGINILPGDKITVFDGDIFVGSGIVEENQQFTVSLIAQKDDPTSQDIDGFQDGNEIHFRYYTESQSEPIILQATGIFGTERFTAFETYVCSLKGSASSISEGFSKETLTLACFPNPVKDVLRIDYSLYQSGQIELVIFDNVGNRITVVEDGSKISGLHTILLDSNNLRKGMYFIRLQFSTLDGFRTKAIKFIKS